MKAYALLTTPPKAAYALEMPSSNSRNSEARRRIKRGWNKSARAALKRESEEE